MAHFTAMAEPSNKGMKMYQTLLTKQLENKANDPRGFGEKVSGGKMDEL